MKKSYMTKWDTELDPKRVTNIAESARITAECHVRKVTFICACQLTTTDTLNFSTYLEQYLLPYYLYLITLYVH